MKKNMSTLDRSLRIIAAVAIMILYFTKVITGTAAIVLLVLGGVFLVTSFLGNCPLYTILGISSCRRAT